MAPDVATTCNHTSPETPHPASSPPRWSETNYNYGFWMRSWGLLLILASCCSVAAARWLISKPAQPTSGSRWKRNPIIIDPFFKRNLMKVIQAEQTLTWNASLPRRRCVRGRSQAVTTSVITRQEPVNNTNEYQWERFTRPEMGRVSESVQSQCCRSGWRTDLHIYLLG